MSYLTLTQNFNNTEEWYQNIPKDIRPHKKQPFYHLFAENEEIYYIAYVSQQNLLPDNSKLPVRHPEVIKKNLVILMVRDTNY